jgi:hypothetical protein
VKRNYHYSGKSTPEAFAHFHAEHLARLPRWSRRIVARMIKLGVLRMKMQVVCDGCGVRGDIGVPELADDGRWLGTEWTHRARLDFCPACSTNGTAERAVADGAKPLGTYTMEVE